MTVGIIDYGCGNLFSLKCSFERIGANVRLINDCKNLSKCDRIVLPGVGAFGDAAKKLVCGGLYDAIYKAARSTPLLGICLGMQLLFDIGYEYGTHTGLSLIHGAVNPLVGYIENGLKVPHMGWNSLDIIRRNVLFKYTDGGEYVYFVHSYHATDCERDTDATVFYGGKITAAVSCGHIFGTQFHPEKSGDTGLRILKAFTEL